MSVVQVKISASLKSQLNSGSFHARELRGFSHRKYRPFACCHFINCEQNRVKTRCRLRFSSSFVFVESVFAAFTFCQDDQGSHGQAITKTSGCCSEIYFHALVHPSDVVKSKPVSMVTGLQEHQPRSTASEDTRPVLAHTSMIVIGLEGVCPDTHV